MRLDPKNLGTVIALLPLALLAVASCSTASEVATTTEDTSRTQAATDNTSPLTAVAPDPAFDPLLPTLEQMTTASIMLPASLPPEIKSVGIEEKASEADPYVTEGDKYSILLLYDDTAPNQIIKPYVHYMTAGRITAWPASAPPPDPTNGSGTPLRLGDVALPDGTVANLERLEPPQGANYGPFTVGMFEEEGERYTVMIENDSSEGDLVRQILSTMVRVPMATNPTPKWPIAGELKSFSLEVGNDVSQGATVNVDAEAPIDNVGLVIARARDPRQVIEPIGWVPLGHIESGPNKIPWDFKANGSTLGAGDYVVYLGFLDDQGRPQGGPRTPQIAQLHIASDGGTSVQMSWVP